MLNEDSEIQKVDARRLNATEFRALDSLLRGRGSSFDERVVQDAVDRELGRKK